MANQDRRPPPQPAEDMFGRPTDVRHEQDEQAPTREQQAAHPRPGHEASDEYHKRCEQEAEDEVACGGIGEIPDGDGVRSDHGTNPLPEGYWAAYPGTKPDDT